jgi:hypothetical protein
MSAPIIECIPTEDTRRLVADGWAAYEAATAEHGPADEWDRRVIDQAIHAFALQSKPFSANDLRPLLPEVRKCLISRRLIKAQTDEVIRHVGYTASTLPSTKSHPVKVYRALPGAADRIQALKGATQ